MHKTIAYIDYEFPSLSGTFTYREFSQGLALGYPLRVIAAQRPDPSTVSIEAAHLIPSVDYVGTVPFFDGLAALSALALRHPVRVLAALALLARPVHPLGKWPAYAYHLLYAARVVETRDLSDVGLLHAPFGGDHASRAMFISVLTGIPFSVMCHAGELYAVRTALRAKMRRARIVSTISEYNRAWLLQRYPWLEDRIVVVRCGIPLPEFRYRERVTARVPLVLSIGRLTDKKGHDTLVRACALLRERGQEFKCKIIGGGPDEAGLRRLVRDLRLENIVQLSGAMPHDKAHEALDRADVFALACRESSNGDLDGIPVALMEAMAMGVPAVSTTVSGIPELIAHGESGFLVAPNDSRALADAIAGMLGDDGTRLSCIRAARRKIESEFQLSTNVALLFRRFSDVMGDADSAPRVRGSSSR